MVSSSCAAYSQCLGLLTFSTTMPQCDVYLPQQLHVESFATFVLPDSNCNDAAHQCLHCKTQFAAAGVHTQRIPQWQLSSSLAWTFGWTVVLQHHSTTTCKELQQHLEAKRKRRAGQLLQKGRKGCYTEDCIRLKLCNSMVHANSRWQRTL